MKRSVGATVRFISIIGFVAFAALTYLLGPQDYGERPWRSFDVVLIPRGADVQEAVERLRLAGETPIDFASASVRVQDFLAGETVFLSELTDRFESADPRLDPFLRRADELFRTGAGNALVYLPRRGSMPGRRGEINAALRGMPFSFVGWNPMPAILSALGALAVVGFAFRARYIRRWPVLLAAFPLIAHAAAGGPAGLVRAALFCYAWAVALERLAFREREMFNYGGTISLESEDVFAVVYGSVATILAVATVVGEPLRLRIAALLSTGALVAALLLITVLWHLSHRARIRRSEHRLFSPRPILARSVWRKRGLSPLAAGVPWVTGALLISLGIVMAWSDFSDDGVLIPQPEHLAIEPSLTEAGPNYPAVIAAIESVNPRVDPLSTAGFIAHRWYQEGMLYGAEYTIPRYEENLTLTRYVEADGTIRSRQEIVASFNTQWLATQQTLTQHGVYQIIVDEGGLFVVRQKPVHLSVLSARRAVELFAIVLFSILPLVFVLRSRSTLGTVMTNPIREQQNA